jgi:phosphatidylglycerophosphatase A
MAAASPLPAIGVVSTTLARESQPMIAATRPSAGFMRRHPAHWVALGFGSGLSPKAPGTVGTLWGWVAFLVFGQLWPGLPWGPVIVLALAGGLWACTLTAQHLGTADPGAIVWDEIVAIWQAGQAIGWRQGFGILFDDVVAAACTLLVLALVMAFWRLW